MDDNAKIAMVQTLVNNDPEATSEVCSVYLSLAAEQMLHRLYPFDSTKTEIPSQYDVTQCELARNLFLRRGAEGEKIHNENGIYRTWGTVNDEEILGRLTPFAKVATGVTGDAQS